jgi:hypothetical protein
LEVRVVQHLLQKCLMGVVEGTNEH